MTDLISRNVNLLCTCLCKLGQKMTVLICFIFPVTCCLVTKFSLTLWDHTDCSTPGFLVHHQLLSIKLVMPSNHLILCCSLLLLSSIYPSIRVFSSESILCITWPEYWSFRFSISLPSVYSGLISFRIDWLDFLAVQGTLKSLLQHHSSQASILRCSAFFIVPTITCIHDYWKNHTLD